MCILLIWRKCHSLRNWFRIHVVDIYCLYWLFLTGCLQYYPVIILRLIYSGLFRFNSYRYLKHRSKGPDEKMRILNWSNGKGLSKNASKVLWRAMTAIARTEWYSFFKPFHNNNLAILTELFNGCQYTAGHI